MHQDQTNAHTERIAVLISKHLENNLTSQEKAELDLWLSTSPKERELFSKFMDNGYVRGELEKLYSYDPKAGWQKIQNAHAFNEKPAITRSIARWKYWIAAAILIILASAGALLFYFPKQEKPVAHHSSNKPADIAAPAVSKATITLQDGRKITLDSLNAGMVAMQENISIQKTQGGEILYGGSQPTGKTNIYNTLTNPRGSKVIQLTLSDGTKVWLNVESEMHYPVVFNAPAREIEITGEAYLEVAANASKPFIVKANDIAVQVIGTHFNINAYKDETAVKVTLLEGGVKVAQKNTTVVLRPGEQAQVDDNIKVDKSADTEQAIAWKNGIFSFKDSDIGTIMRQLSKWYDVEVHFKDNITEHFYGEISREKNISSVLNMLQMTGSVHFETKGNTIEVKK